MRHQLMTTSAKHRKKVGGEGEVSRERVSGSTRHAPGDQFGRQTLQSADDPFGSPFRLFEPSRPSGTNQPFESIFNRANLKQRAIRVSERAPRTDGGVAATTFVRSPTEVTKVTGFI